MRHASIARVRLASSPGVLLCAGMWAAASLLGGGAAGAQQAEANWSQFRGPNGQGAAPQARIPARFGPGQNERWKTTVPAGHSSPVVWVIASS